MSCKFCNNVTYRNQLCKYHYNREVYLKAKTKDPDRRKRICFTSYHKRRKAIFNLLGNSCECCGEDRYEFLSIDHIDGGGTKHYKIRNSTGVYTDVLNDPNRRSKYRILCHNCNMALAHNTICPHKIQGNFNCEQYEQGRSNTD